MKTLLKTFFLTGVLLGMGLSLSACNQQLENFVDLGRPIGGDNDGGGDNPKINPPEPAKPGLGIKMSPGAVQATGATTGMNANITTTNQKLKGTSVGMSVGLSRSRTSQ